MKTKAQLYAARYQKQFGDSTIVDCILNKELGVEVEFFNDIAKSRFILTLNETENLIKSLQLSLDSVKELPNF